MANRRTTNEEKRIRGTNRPSREREESRALAAAPDPPAWLSEAGEMRFRALAKQLADAGHVTTLDAGVLGRFVQVELDIETAEAAIGEHGRYYTSDSGYTQKSAPATDLEKLRREWLKLAKELGLTPYSRGRVDAKPPVEKKTSPWEQFK